LFMGFQRRPSFNIRLTPSIPYPSRRRSIERLLERYGMESLIEVSIKCLPAMNWQDSLIEGSIEHLLVPDGKGSKGSIDYEM